MARHILKNMVVNHDANTLDGVRSMEIEATAPDVDLTAAGDSWQSRATGIPHWTGSIALVLDHEAAANQTLQVGDSITFEGYSEGDASGKTYWTGTALVTGHKLGGSYDAEGTREYTLVGNGALSSATVV